MGIRRGQEEAETSPFPSPLSTPGFGKKRIEKQILNYKKYVNKITKT